MIKTAECVSPNHPDKICDRISDAILDECLRQDPDTRAAIETMGGHGIITVTGELTTKAYVNIADVVKRVAGEDIGVQVNVVLQSFEISGGVDTGGAGDQGIMVGYACSSNRARIPTELLLARELCKNIYYKVGELDGKTQITMDGENITHVVASFQSVSKKVLERIVYDWILTAAGVCENNFNILLGISSNIKVLINPAGDWDMGGFDADTGLTGRKLIADNYGPNVPIGGGAYSGKDGTKVDRSGAYYARKMAMYILDQKMIEYALACQKDVQDVTVKLAYAIGVINPVQAYAIIRLTDSTNPGIIEEETMDLIGLYDFRPKHIIDALQLKTPIFEQTAEWGAYGNMDIDVPWESYGPK